MGNGAVIFGGHVVATTGQLAQAIRARGMEAGDRSQIVEALQKGGVEDTPLFEALRAADGNESAAALLEDLSRSSYWERLSEHLSGGAIRRFGTAEEASAGLVEAFSRRSLPAGITIHENVALPNEDGKKGTIIEWGGDATFAQLYEVLTRVLNSEEDSTRLALPEDFARRILHWGYREHFKVYREGALYYEISMKQQRGEALSPDEERFMQELPARIEKDWKASSATLRFLTLIGSLSVKSIDARFLQETIANVVHDVKYVTSAWNSLLLDVRDGKAKPPHSPAGSLVDMIAYARNLHMHELNVAKAELKIDAATKTLLQQHTLAEDIDWIVTVSNAIDNLIGNAIKYKDERQALVITVQAVRLTNGSIQITVSDNGRGIGHHRLVQVAMPQWREKPAERVLSHPEVPGEGRGLANTAEGLARYGSFLSVRSDEEDGASFRFVLPAPHLRKNGKPAGIERGVQSDMAEALKQGFHAEDYQDAYLIPSVLMHGEVLQHIVKLAESGNRNAALNLKEVVRNSDYENQEAEHAFLRLHVTKLAEEWSPADFFVFINTGSLHAVLGLLKSWPELFSRYVASDAVRPPLRLLKAAEANNPKGNARLAVLLLAAGGNQSSLDWVRSKDGYRWIRELQMTPAQTAFLKQLR